VNVASWFELVSWRDVIDIALVFVVIYYLLLLIRGTRAVQILLGILFLGGIYYLAGSVQLVTLQSLLFRFLSLLPLAIIVLFQQEIRRALANFGRNPLWGLSAQTKVHSTIQEVEVAASALSASRTGALMVLQRLEGLRNYIENGVEIDALVSHSLLVNLFSPETPLHDGAAIIQQDRIAAASCFLPISSSSGLSKELGTRPRAAIGITEETDALAVVVSEETGGISIALGGQLQRNLDAKALRNKLYQYLIRDIGTQVGRPK
jgi:diadenylate cyclase